MNSKSWSLKALLLLLSILPSGEEAPGKALPAVPVEFLDM